MRHFRRTGRTAALRAGALAVGALAAVVGLSSCAGVLSAIEDRLPPPHEVKDGMLFSYYSPSARQVTLAGNFNNWGGTQGGGRYDPSIDPMSDPDGDGVWTIAVPLPPGRYQYKFVIDGGVRWEQDPNNPDKATEGGFENSLIVVSPGVRYAAEVVTGTGVTREATRVVEQPADAAAVPVTFELAAPDAREVSVAGTFNAWDPLANPLAKGEGGVFRATLDIRPGSHEYKFVVDGTWVEDPANPETVPDPYGGKNSVLTVK
ncbi:MAG: glycogen-binding domain-containing protein [Candidatus Eisenbacteria bacterium]|nr:glycogen-binding domain-containing protein [Candidatus Eisenbacteria bacterium]